MAYVRQHPDPRFAKFRVKVGVMPDFSGSEFMDQEVPTGEMDGVNRVFTLSQRPLRFSEEIFKDGMKMKRASNALINDGDYFIDYSKVPVTIVFSEKQTPQPKSVILASYKYMKQG